MIELINDGMLRGYVRAASWLHQLRTVRDQRGQAFTDYLIVIALVALLIMVAAPVAKTGVSISLKAFWDGVGKLLGKIDWEFV